MRLKSSLTDFKKVSWLTVSDGEMQKKSIVESRFSQINDKRFYFADGINSIPLSHPYLRELIDFKQKMDRKLSDIFGKRKKLFEIENRTQNLNEQLFLSH